MQPCTLYHFMATLDYNTYCYSIILITVLLATSILPSTHTGWHHPPVSMVRKKHPTLPRLLLLESTCSIVPLTKRRRPNTPVLAGILTPSNGTCCPRSGWKASIGGSRMDGSIWIVLTRKRRPQNRREHTGMAPPNNGTSLSANRRLTVIIIIIVIIVGLPFDDGCRPPQSYPPHPPRRHRRPCHPVHVDLLRLTRNNKTRGVHPRTSRRPRYEVIVTWRPSLGLMPT